MCETKPQEYFSLATDRLSQKSNDNNTYIQYILNKQKSFFSFKYANAFKESNAQQEN